MSKKVLLFDFDGTIADTLPVAVSIVNRHGAAYGIKSVSPEDVERLKGLTPKEVMVEFKVPLYKLPFFLNKIRGELLRRMNEVRIFPGVKSALASLKRDGYTLAIVTSSPKENVLKFLELRDLMMFDFVYSNKNIFGKARTISSIINRKGQDSIEYIYIGDEVRDISASQKNHIPIVSVSWGFNSKAILSKYHPDRIVDTPAEMVKNIKNLT